MEFTLAVNDKDVEVIGAALAELPFKQVAGLVNKLQVQINEQSTAATATDETEAKAEKKK